MINITLVTNGPNEYEIVRENMTVREFLEKHGVNYANGTTSIDGNPVGIGGLDKTFGEYELREKAIVSCLANKDNGAQAIIAGSACMIKSTLTPEDIKRIKKFHPEALQMTNEDGRPLFVIDIDEETPGEIDNNGACFGNAPSTDGKATITVVIDPVVENTEELVYNKIGRALMYLKEMEQHIAEVLPDLDTEEREIRSMITRI